MTNNRVTCPAHGHIECLQCAWPPFGKTRYSDAIREYGVIFNAAFDNDPRLSSVASALTPSQAYDFRHKVFIGWDLHLRTAGVQSLIDERDRAELDNYRAKAKRSVDGAANEYYRQMRGLMNAVPQMKPVETEPPSFDEAVSQIHRKRFGMFVLKQAFQILLVVALVGALVAVML